MGEVSGGEQKDLWRLNLENKQWELVGEGPVDFTPRHSAISFSINDSAYIGLGDDGFGNQLADFWEYQVIDNKWIRRFDFPRTDSVIVQMAFPIQGKGYAGGLNSEFNSIDIWQYTPEN